MEQAEATQQQTNKKDMFFYVIILIPILLSTIETFFYEIFQGSAKNIYWHFSGLLLLTYYIIRREFKVVVFMVGVMLAAILIFQ